MTTERLERHLAVLLSHGTALASAVVAAGFLAAFRFPQGHAIETAGLAIFILLPVLRVALMLMAFARRREPLFTVLAGVVLMIIGLGTLLALRSAG